MTLNFYAFSFPSTLTSELDLHYTVLASRLTELPSEIFELFSSCSAWSCRGTVPSPDPGKAPNQAGQAQHALRLILDNLTGICCPSAMVLLHSSPRHPLSAVSASREMQAFSSSASCSSSLTLSFLCGRARVMLPCRGPYLLSWPSGEQRPSCSLPSSPERDFPSLMYQISDRLTSFSFSSIHPLILLLNPQKVGWQIYRPKLYASCRRIL